VTIDVMAGPPETRNGAATAETATAPNNRTGLHQERDDEERHDAVDVTIDVMAGPP